MTEPIPIAADDRETRAPVLAALRDMDDFDVTVRRLTVGDYRVDNRWLFERKTSWLTGTKHFRPALQRPGGREC